MLYAIVFAFTLIESILYILRKQTDTVRQFEDMCHGYFDSNRLYLCYNIVFFTVTVS